MIADKKHSAIKKNLARNSFLLFGRATYMVCCKITKTVIISLMKEKK